MGEGEPGAVGMWPGAAPTAMSLSPDAAAPAALAKAMFRLPET